MKKKLVWFQRGTRDGWCAFDRTGIRWKVSDSVVCRNCGGGSRIGMISVDGQMFCGSCVDIVDSFGEAHQGNLLRIRKETQGIIDQERREIKRLQREIREHQEEMERAERLRESINEQISAIVYHEKKSAAGGMS